MDSFRKSIGIPGLDVVLEGGVLSSRSYLIVGTAGTGKTVCALQWLREGVRLQEKCLYITLAEPSEDIKKNAKTFNWTLEGITFLDLTPHNLPNNHTVEEYQIFSPAEVEELGVWENIYQTIKNDPPERLVIDSVTQLRYLSMDEFQFRKHINGLVKILNSLNITTFLLFEPMELAKEAATALAVDGIFHLRMDITGNRVIGIRTFQVTKFRGSDFIPGYHPFRISSQGIHIFPHITEKTGDNIPGESLVSFGISELDELLKGGIEIGTTTIVSGPSGVGKSTIAAQLLVHASTIESKGLLYVFEESIESVIKRCSGLGINLKEKMDKGIIKVIRVNPMEIYPDQFLEQMRDAVEKEHFKLVVIDSLRGYHLAMEEYGTLLSHIHNMVTYLNRMNVTTILINEVVAITGNVRITELGISHLADNIILIRYAEHMSKLIKIICCLKKRLGDFETELRQMKMDSKGIHVGTKLEKLHGILSGIPNSIF